MEQEASRRSRFSSVRRIAESDSALDANRHISNRYSSYFLGS